uniref:Regulatory protein E2 n=1 Tax=Human papillomavirus TaxID=10566 RepID=A0A3R5V978_9PAPI|nr:MAG: E2 protein [Human papillomavirus]
METQQTLTDRFAAQQDIQMTLIEKESTDLTDHIMYWDSVRLENILGYYARREGYNRLGVQPLPVAAVLEYKAKDAIKMKLLLTSLKKSIYGSEPWTLAEVSSELMNTNPKNCFKKQPFTVTVLFDNNENNSFPYICWDFIYYQDENSEWHKVKGQVDGNGLYYQEITGDTVYFTLFHSDAETYGNTGTWTVRFKNETIFAPVSSSTRSATESETRAPSHAFSKPKASRKRKQTDSDTDSDSPTSTTGLRLRRRGSGERKSTPRATPQRRRRRLVGSAPSPEEVGSGSRSVPRQGLTRLGRLQEEARDPFLIALQGCPNTLKCFRNRFHSKYPSLYVSASTVFHWIIENNEDRICTARMLIAFDTAMQREVFLSHVTIPKGTEYWFGSIEKL